MFVCAVVEPRMRAAAVAWEAPAKIFLAFSLLCSDDRSVACVLRQRVLRQPAAAAAAAAAVAAAVAAAAAAVAAAAPAGVAAASSKRMRRFTSRDESHRAGPLAEQKCVGSGCIICISWAGSSWPMEFRRHGRKQTNEDQTLVIKKHIGTYAYIFKYGPTYMPSHGPARQIHGPAHGKGGPARTEPVSLGLDAHVIGRAGRARQF